MSWEDNLNMTTLYTFVSLLLSYDLNDTIIVETFRTLVYIHVLDSGATRH